MWMLIAAGAALTPAVTPTGALPQLGPDTKYIEGWIICLRNYKKGLTAMIFPADIFSPPICGQFISMIGQRKGIHEKWPQVRRIQTQSGLWVMEIKFSGRSEGICSFSSRLPILINVLDMCYFYKDDQISPLVWFTPTSSNVLVWIQH